ncbi:MAG: hypothetical protein ABI724_16990 [Betaproteobacteria bacterium]
MNVRGANPGKASDALRFIGALLTGLWLGCAGAQVPVLGTILSDTWWDKTQSGWGVLATHNEPVIFLAFYIYAADRRPYFVTATVTAVPGATFETDYTGDLYESTGPWFGGTFDPATVTRRKVGTVTFATDYVTATLTYVIDGVQVFKSLERLTLRNLDFAGTYTGAINYAAQDCVSPPANRPTIVDAGPLTISKTGNTVTMVLAGAKANCAIVGAYFQTGTLGNVIGTLSCSDGTSGQGGVVLMQRGPAGMIAGLSFENSLCSVNGTISGILPP